MKKKINFDTAKNDRREEKIKKVLNQEFEIPEIVNQAKKDAFDQIRAKAAQDQAKHVKQKRKVKTIYKAATGMAAAAAAFSAICITNPAWAAEIPVIGSVFEKIGTSLGFAGDYEKYATKLADGEENKEEAEVQGPKAEETEEETKDSGFTKTSNGVTVTMSEVYCNDTAMNVALTIQTEEPFPETMTDQNGMPILHFGTATEMPLSYNPDFKLVNSYLDGEMVDDHTYAGVLRIEMWETTQSDTAWAEYDKDRDAWLEEKGVDVDAFYEGNLSFEDVEAILGIEDFTNEDIAAAGGPDPADYDTTLTVPEEFTADLKLKEIVGYLPQNQDTTPEMPQELKDEYNKAMAEHGLDEANYENFTEEEKEIEHQLYTEMWNKYTEMYPETAEGENEHNTWTLEGDWSFSIPVKKDLSDHSTKEINLVDENGLGIASVTKTPFELQINEAGTNPDYFYTILDANGEPLDNGNHGGNANICSIKDRDVSKIYVYVCDYVEYMDEIKGYYWSDDYEEKKKTKTYKEYLDEKSLYHTEVTFE